MATTKEIEEGESWHNVLETIQKHCDKYDVTFVFTIRFKTNAVITASKGKVDSRGRPVRR